MGDMAEYFINLGVEEQLNMDMKRRGYGHEEDEEDEDNSGRPYRKRVITCNKCSATGLHWENTQNGHRLFCSNGEMHECYGGKNFDDSSKSPIGRVQLGKRSIERVIDREHIGGGISDHGTIVYDWDHVKSLVRNNTNKDQYVDITTTTLNNKIAWVVKVKMKKGSREIQENIKFPPTGKPPF